MTANNTPESFDAVLAEPARYVVLKASGSRYAYVQDTQERRTVKRYDIFKGAGKRNGWMMAEEHARQLNAAIDAALANQEPPHDH